MFEKLQACIWFDVNFVTRRNLVATLVSSFLFFSAWWIIIGVSAATMNAPKFSYHICGILSTVSFLMVNVISKDMIDRNGYEGGVCGNNGAKIWLVIGFFLGFISIFASLAFCLAKYKHGLIDQAIAVVVQNVLIILASIVYRFGKRDSSGTTGF